MFLLYFFSLRFRSMFFKKIMQQMKPNANTIIIITNQRLTSSMHQTKHSHRKRCKIKIPFFRRCIYIYIYTYIKRKIGRIFLCATGKFSYSLKATQNKYREQQKIKNKFKSIKQKVKKKLKMNIEHSTQ